MVKIIEVSPPRYPFDWNYIFEFDYPIDLKKAHDNLRKYDETRYTRWVMRVVGKPKLGYRVWISKNPYSYPYAILVDNVNNKGIIEVRGFWEEVIPVTDYSKKSILYYTLKDLLLPFVKEGLITSTDYSQILSYFIPPIVIPKALIVYIEEFIFWVSEDWKFKVYVESPDYWIPSYGVPLGDLSYGIKVRASAFLEVTGISPFRIRDLVGYVWKPLTSREIALRESYGMPALVRNRRMLIDPNNLISVREVSRKADRILWEVDFSRVPRLPIIVDIDSAYEKVKNYYRAEIIEK